MRPENAAFAAKLRAWRGKRLQKQAADALHVSVRTYQSWEGGVNKPTEKLSMADVDRLMAENPDK